MSQFPGLLNVDDTDFDTESELKIVDVDEMDDIDDISDDEEVDREVSEEQIRGMDVDDKENNKLLSNISLSAVDVAPCESSPSSASASSSSMSAENENDIDRPISPSKANDARHIERRDEESTSSQSDGDHSHTASTSASSSDIDVEDVTATAESSKKSSKIPNIPLLPLHQISGLHIQSNIESGSFGFRAEVASSSSSSNGNVRKRRSLEANAEPSAPSKEELEMGNDEDI